MAVDSSERTLKQRETLYQDTLRLIQIVRWPLDHVFHSACFTLGALWRLPHIGSDHFPMHIELCYEPEASSAAPPLPAEARLEDTAQEQIKRDLREKEA